MIVGNLVPHPLNKSLLPLYYVVSKGSSPQWFTLLQYYLWCKNISIHVIIIIIIIMPHVALKQNKISI